MRILFLGDVMGRAGRAAVQARLPQLRADWKLDFVVINGENASGGMGLTPDHARLLLAAGADALTLGDHAFDQKDMLGFIESEPRIIRPLNYARGAPGRARTFDRPMARILPSSISARAVVSTSSICAVSAAASAPWGA